MFEAAPVWLGKRLGGAAEPHEFLTLQLVIASAALAAALGLLLLARLPRARRKPAEGAAPVVSREAQV